MMFKPVNMAMPQVESVFREECQKTPVSIVFVKPGTRARKIMNGKRITVTQGLRGWYARPERN